MKEDGLGTLFLRQLVMAIPWGIVFLLVIFVAAAVMKQEIKEGMQYGIRIVIHETAGIVHSDKIVSSVKRNIKEY